MSLCNVFDLHCDTVCECATKGLTLENNQLNIDISNAVLFKKWVQTFAFWIDDCFKGESAFENFLLQYNCLQKEFERTNMLARFDGEPVAGKCNALMSIEGGHVLGGDLKLVAKLKAMGISFLTLVWNGDNELGCGVKGGKTGLTKFGFDAVKELQKNGIVVDVSHLNEQGFYDVCSVSTKPIIATHSNAYSVCKNKRNLKDDQLSYIINNNGLCGINFYPVFVTGNIDCTLLDIKKHIDHILALGGDDILALGSDFDGAPMPTQLNHVTKLNHFHDKMVEWYGDALSEKIFFSNAKKFIDNNFNCQER